MSLWTAIFSLSTDVLWGVLSLRELWLGHSEICLKDTPLLFFLFALGHYHTETELKVSLVSVWVTDGVLLRWSSFRRSSISPGRTSEGTYVPWQVIDIATSADWHGLSPIVTCPQPHWTFMGQMEQCKKSSIHANYFIHSQSYREGVGMGDGVLQIQRGSVIH